MKIIYKTIKDGFESEEITIDDVTSVVSGDVAGTMYVSDKTVTHIIEDIVFFMVY